jgi:dTMP kinase
MSSFITFEGGEGTGKSTQAKALFRKLTELGFPVLLVKEPGGTPLGKALAKQLKHSQAEIAPLSELLLFAAARAQLVSEVIMPALAQGKVVMCDRFADSTTAYQGYGWGLDLALIEAVNNAATAGLCPDITILLDIEVEKGLQRKQLKKDRFEREAIAFHQRVRQGYLEMAAKEPERWFVVDASKPKAKVTEIIWERVAEFLSLKRP